MERNGPHYCRRDEPLAVSTSHDPSRCHPWRDTGVQRLPNTLRAVHVGVRHARCRPCGRTPNTTIGVPLSDTIHVERFDCTPGRVQNLAGANGRRCSWTRTRDSVNTAFWISKTRQRPGARRGIEDPSVMKPPAQSGRPGLVEYQTNPSRIAIAPGQRTRTTLSPASSCMMLSNAVSAVPTLQRPAVRHPLHPPVRDWSAGGT